MMTPKIEPKDAPPPITDWGKYRTAGLCIAAFFAIRFGLLYTPLLPNRPLRVPPALKNITALLPPATDTWQPIWLLGFIWVGLGIIALLAIAVWQLQNFVYIAMTLFTLYWALAYFTTFLTDDESPGYADIFAGSFILVPVLWLAICGLMTRRGRTELDMPPLRTYREDGPAAGHRVD